MARDWASPERQMAVSEAYGVSSYGGGWGKKARNQSQEFCLLGHIRLSSCSMYYTTTNLPHAWLNFTNHQVNLKKKKEKTLTLSSLKLSSCRNNACSKYVLRVWWREKHTRISLVTNFPPSCWSAVNHHTMTCCTRLAAGIQQNVGI